MWPPRIARSPVRRRALLAPFVLAWALASVAGWAADEPERSGPRLGWLLDAANPPELPRADSDRTAATPVVRLRARWDRVERVRGAFDWTEISPEVDRARAAGYEVALALSSAHPDYLPEGGEPSPFAGESMEAWLGFVRGAARTFAGRVTVFELGDAPPGRGEEQANLRALVLKQATLALRAELAARGAEARIAPGALPAGNLDWLRALWSRDLAAYIDVLPVSIDAADDPAAQAEVVRGVFEESLAHPPAPELWVHVHGGEGWDAAGLAVSALTRGATVALFEPADVDSSEAQLDWSLGVQRTLNEGYAPAAPGRLRLDYAGSVAPRRARVLGRFVNEEDFTTLVLFLAPEALAGGGAASLIVDAPSLRDVRGLDPVSGRTRRVRNVDADGGSGRAVPLQPGASPGAVLYRTQVVTPGFELDTEDVEVASRRGLTAEEVIARYQLVQREQDDRLERWMARGRTDFHFRLAQGTSTVDVTIDSTYFWARGAELEWEQTAYYVNGNKVRWKNIPELPLIQPEKVVTLPLDLTLDKTYRYRLVGRDRVQKREAYVVAFEPASVEPQVSLYRGRVWIDAETFVRLRASVVQGGLEAPVLSNEEVDRFAPQTGPDGKPYWMFENIDGQQTWKAGGRTFVVQREIRFEEYRINPPRDEFERSRAQAYASSNQMLRDTDEGFRYLERQEDGGRTVKQGVDSSQLFAAAGAFKDRSQDNVVPLAGVNYFNYDLWGKNVQVNALFAGVLGFFTASKPTLGGTNLDLTADVGLSALKGEDQVFEGQREVLAETIESRSQRLALRFGIPAGQFFRFNLVGRLVWREYFDSDDGRAAITRFNDAPMPPAAQLEFVLPENHVEYQGEIEVEFNRKGYSLILAGTRASRSDWQPWGLRDTASASFGTLIGDTFVATSGEPVRDDFSRWQATLSKEWYLPKFQKIRGAVDWLDGSDLDRFSRYQFSFFGDDRLNGFSGSGVRFDEGVIGRVGYAFNLFEVIRFDAALDAARVEQEGAVGGAQSFSGIGLSANVVGPWKTVINFNYGYALSSDIPDLEGEQEFLLIVLKLF